MKLLDQECYKCIEDTNIPCCDESTTYVNCSGLLQTRTIFVSRWFWYTSIHPSNPSGSFTTGCKLAMASQGLCFTMRCLDFRAFVLGPGDVYNAAKTSFLLRLQDSHLPLWTSKCWNQKTRVGRAYPQTTSLIKPLFNCKNVRPTLRARDVETWLQGQWKIKRRKNIFKI